MAYFYQQLIDHNNPDEVRRRLAEGGYHSPSKEIAKSYLDDLDRKEAIRLATNWGFANIPSKLTLGYFIIIHKL